MLNKNNERPIDLSVIICTRNRAAILRQTLARICACAIPPELCWELIIADNHSTDHTRSAVNDFTGVLPVVYECVKTPGKVHALNRSLELAQADRVIFLDDDIFPDWRIFNVYLRAFQEFSDVNLFGGRIELALPEKYDLDLVSLPQARLVLPQSDFGSVQRFLRYPETPAGPNMAIRRSGLDPAPHFAFKPLKGYGFTVEDTLFFKQYMLQGQPVLYLPSARVGHLVREDQLSLNYFRERYCFFRLIQPIVDELPPAATIFNVQRYLLKSLIVSAARFACRSLRGRREMLSAYLELMAAVRSVARPLDKPPA